MGDCQFVEAHMDAWLDGELDAAATARFERHVTACPACAERIRLERSISADFETLGHIAGRIAHEGAVADAAPRRRFRVWRAAATIALVVGAGYAATMLIRSASNPKNGQLARTVEPDDEANQAPIRLSMSLADDDTRLSVRMPSDDPRVHIIWLYETEPPRSGASDDAGTGEVTPGNGSPLANPS